MARKTLKQIEETRSDLINAARECFLRYGIAHSSLEQIAQHAGVTRGTIYSQFPHGKSDLFQAVYNDLEIKINQWLIQPINKDLSGLENLRKFIQNWLKTICDCGWLRQKFEISFQAMSQGDSIRKCKKNNFPDFVRKAEEIIKYAQQKKEISADKSAQFLSIQLVSMFVGLTVIWHHEDWNKDKIAHGGEALEAWLRQISNDGGKI